MKYGSTNRDVRATNRKLVVNTLFHNEPMTKQNLVEKTGLSLATISYILKDLADKGLISRGSKLDSSGGRPACYIQPNYNSGYSIGINISNKFVRIAMSDLAPNLINKAKYSILFEDTKEYWASVNDILKRFISDQNVDLNKLLGVGLSISAVMNHNSDIAYYVNNNIVNKLDLCKIRNYFDYDVVINNAAKMAGFAQAWGAMDTRDLIYITIDDIIAGAIVSDLNVLNFPSRNAEFGHMIIVEKGRSCFCGKNGCLNAYCSLSALSQISGTSVNTFFKGLETGNETYQNIFDEYLVHLSTAINNIRLVFDTDVVIGGEMSIYLEKYIDRLQALLGAINPFGDDGTYTRIGKYGEYDSAIGAGLIHNNNHLS